MVSGWILQFAERHSVYAGCLVEKVVASTKGCNFSQRCLILSYNGWPRFFSFC
jgi:hypothetical protein